MQSQVGAVHGDEGLAEIAQAGFSGAVERRFGQDHQHASARGLAEAVKAERIVAQAPGRLASRFLAHFDLGHEVAQRRIGAGELDAGGLAHQAAAAVAADQIVCAQGLAVGERQVDAGLVLREARHLQVSIDRHSELFDPAGQDALDMALPQCEPVSVPGGEVADVERGPGEAGELGDLSFAQETIRDAALVEDLDAARVPDSSWSARRSTTATSTFASASSAASIKPVGPPPTITTAWSVASPARAGVVWPRGRDVGCNTDMW